ncbi:unnamed protein product [Somion occarium]|uniref:TECPR1-like DysF domain-containing protein n=1 Tax=Somion occarium TaxID=3059160 RepID=A0ABP1E085_9APHY
MATLQYVEIPSAATRLESAEPSADIRPAPKIVTNMPHPEKAVGGLTSPTAQPQSPKNPGFNFQQILLSSALPIPSNVPASLQSVGKGAPRLLTTRDPLSIPITTVNFRRFVSKMGPGVWLIDRMEEIIMWKKGWEYTTVFIAAYAFFCYFPRMVLLLPLVIMLVVILITDPYLRQPESSSLHEDISRVTVPPPPPPQIGEGSVDWLANLQAIQNLMGSFSDLNDLILPYIPHINHTSPYTPIVFTTVLTLLVILVPIVNFIPLRLTCLILGLFPFFLTHPFTQSTLIPTLLASIRPHLKHFHTLVVRYVDDDRLEDKHWRTEMQEVELWENERWSPGTTSSEAGGVNVKTSDGGWSKANLKPGERKAWTRGRDGWSAVAEDGSGDVSNLTFSLSPGWLFVETEDWRPDLEGTWISSVGADDAGWVYTNDAWMEPRAYPLEEWKVSNRMTRRRRWMRRIYFDPGTTT